MVSRLVPPRKRVKRWLWKVPEACLAFGVGLILLTVRPTEANAIGLVSTAPVADPTPPSSGRPQVPGEGILRFEVEPDDVEIYLDEQYLGRAGELRGRGVEGILAGNRLLELRWHGERSFLQIVVPINGTRTIRLNLAPPASKGS